MTPCRVVANLRNTGGKGNGVQFRRQAVSCDVPCRVVAHLQASGEKKKKRGITLNLGFGSFA